jgi:hypothetical protein
MGRFLRLDQTVASPVSNFMLRIPRSGSTEWVNKEYSSKKCVKVESEPHTSSVAIFHLLNSFTCDLNSQYCLVLVFVRLEIDYLAIGHCYWEWSMKAPCYKNAERSGRDTISPPRLQRHNACWSVEGAVKGWARCSV